ncbi:MULTISPECIES: hypothetical protein [unclassified Agarivorans]|uniref:hypothetical protein n=1 Tax=unclassified Agarivorans TaxID=2636026 RepID=UPI0026E13BBA|nr:MULTISPECIES: hypothetical protein [unclassified Agarivorans]MDO6685200.1 hypothetical protein [Agarivorans sp. 3_MG-2023]MDO6715628.1 hypothetical protein [Agarivorans sp. 2_MG-2023]
MMNPQLLTELLFISAVLVLTVLGFSQLRGARLTGAEKSEKVLTGFLGGFLLMGGTVKFFEPFTSMFASQIALSELPFPELSKWAGQLGEISVGLSLLVLLIAGRKVPQWFAEKLFYLANLAIVVIMLVAVYVHLHPMVPAEVLPLASKPPSLTLVILFLSLLNVYLHRNNMASAQV